MRYICPGGDIANGSKKMADMWIDYLVLEFAIEKENSIADNLKK